MSDENRHSTWFGTGNFGTDLQCYAFCRYLQNKGLQTFIIQKFQYDYVSLKYLRYFLRNKDHD